MSGYAFGSPDLRAEPLPNIEKIWPLPGVRWSYLAIKKDFSEGCATTLSGPLGR
jgi:hypothetical protein